MRMDTEAIADRRQLFELLTLIKDLAVHAENTDQSHLIDEAITVSSTFVHFCFVGRSG